MENFQCVVNLKFFTFSVFLLATISMSIYKKIDLFIQNELLMFEFVHTVKKVHEDKTSCKENDCEISNFVNPIIDFLNKK